MGPITATGLIWKLFPLVKEIFKATRKKSPNGKAITKAERDEIIASVLPRIGAVLEKELR